jgi:hypothetical protein
MEYKLVSPLKTRHVEPWAEYVFSEKVIDHSQPATSAMVVRKAVECGWFEGEKPDADEMEPKDVVNLATMIYKAYSVSMGFDLKNSPARQPITPKA